MNNFVYNETVAMLRKFFPEQIAISVKEAAKALHVSEGTIRNAISRKVKPLPARHLTNGRILISIPSLASWLSSEGM